MPFLFIRHAEKEHDNGKAGVPFPDDPALTPPGVIATRNHSLNLALKFRPPERVYTSPYLRTRQTAQNLIEGWIPFSLGVSTLNECPTATIPDLIIDRRLSEVFGKRSPKSKKLEPRFDHMTSETFSYLPPLREEESMVTARAVEFLKQLMENHSPDEVVVIVTHGMIIKLLSGKYPEEYLQTVEYTFDKKTKLGRWRFL